MEFNQEALQDMCNKVDLLEYACQSYEFEKKGNDSFVCHCPLHVDKTPSLSVKPSANMFHCFSCGVSGNIISFMTKIEHLSFPQALEKLSKITGTELTNFKQSETVGFFKSMKNINHKEEKVIERQILPYSEYSKYSDELAQEWIDEGISTNQMKRFDIRIDNQTNRIVYPVYDNQFNLIGVKGRTRFKDFKTLKIAKYMNYYKLVTTDFFIGMKENYENIKSHNEIIIVEGIKSVMKLSDYGYDWCVAAETSALNDEQIKLLLKLQIKNIVIAFDNDVDMQKVIKNVEMLKRFTNVYIVSDSKNISKRLLPDDKMSPCDAGKDIFDKLYAERRKL